MSTEPKHRRLIRKVDILERLGNSSQASGYRHVFNRPDFPKPVSLLPGVDMFDESEFDSFMEQLLLEREAVQ